MNGGINIMENILLMLLVTVAILILTEIYDLNMQIKRLERKLRIEKVKGHIRDIELLCKDIHALSEKINK
jgi:hypothetical protein